MMGDSFVGLIMAGGRGQRMAPLTEDTPKPLVPVGGIPMLQIQIEQFLASGIERLYVSVHHRWEMIADFLKASVYSSYVELLNESEPLGTAGALRLLPADLGSSVVVVNADIVTDEGFSGVVETHRSEGADMTVGAFEMIESSPYGVLTTDGDRLIEISEKPIRMMMVSAGCNIVAPSLLANLMIADRPYDMPELIASALLTNSKVVVHRLSGRWKDVGTIADLDAAHMIVSDNKYSSSQGSGID